VGAVVDDHGRCKVAPEAVEVLGVVALEGAAGLPEEAPPDRPRCVEEVDQGVGVFGERRGEDDHLRFFARAGRRDWCALG